MAEELDIFSKVSALLSNERITHFSERVDIIDIIQKLMETTQHDDTGFFVVDISTVIEQYSRWMAELPRVKPFYAVKSNPNPIILKILALLGTGFDCASKNEIIEVIQILSDLGFDKTNISNRIIFANPIKSDNHLRYARQVDVDLMTFDNKYELRKIAHIAPGAQLVIRIKVCDEKSLCQFNSKFGVELTEVDNLLAVAQTLELQVVGVSFHVGSSCGDANVFEGAIASARAVFDRAKQYGFTLRLLDLGGGFPGTDTLGRPAFTEFASVINSSLARYFPLAESDGIEIIAEPGRYFCSASHTLVLNVVGKDKKISSEGVVSFSYTLNDGIYGSLNGIMFDHAQPMFKPFNERDGKTYPCTIYGPTCDSIDTLARGECQLPELTIGESIYIEGMGAYSNASASRFNGFPQTPAVYIMRH
jgi:ornithine decarboxylase